MLERRNRLRKGEYHALIPEMRLLDRDSFYKYFRVIPSRFDSLLSVVGPAISRKLTNFRFPVPPGEGLAVTFIYLAAGGSMQTIAFGYRFDHSTVFNIIGETCDDLWNVLYKQYLKTPPNQTEWKRISDVFYRAWGFPHCLGANDGKHVVMQAAPHSGSITIINIHTALC